MAPQVNDNPRAGNVVSTPARIRDSAVYYRPRRRSSVQRLSLRETATTRNCRAMVATSFAGYEKGPNVEVVVGKKTYKSRFERAKYGDE
jgi:hypothetical protein